MRRRVFAGVDPGVTRGALVIKTPTGILKLARTYEAAMTKYRRGMTTFERYGAMTQRMEIDMVRLKVTHLCIETPVYKRNPGTYALQCMHVGAITQMAIGLGIELIYVGPSSAKKSHTGSGSASKLDMILAGSFSGPGIGDVEDVEAIADAEAMCDYGRKQQGRMKAVDMDTGSRVCFTYK